MFIVKGKLSNGDTVKVTAVGDNFMAALAEVGKTFANELKADAGAIVKLSITHESASTGLRRVKFRPRKETETKVVGALGKRA